MGGGLVARVIGSGYELGWRKSASALVPRALDLPGLRTQRSVAG